MEQHPFARLEVELPEVGGMDTVVGAVGSCDAATAKEIHLAVGLHC
jgi:hypothetical protein